MKQRLIIAFIATAGIILFSCGWFQSKKGVKPNPLVGHWKLDSLHSSKDSTMAFMLTYGVMKDSSGVEFEFKKDTVITLADNVRDTSLYTWDEKNKQLIPADTTEGHFQFARLDDSIVTLTSLDSTWFFLLKK